MSNRIDKYHLPDPAERPRRPGSVVWGEWNLVAIEFFSDLFHYYIGRPATDLQELDSWYQVNRDNLPTTDKDDQVYLGWRIRCTIDTARQK